MYLAPPQRYYRRVDTANDIAPSKLKLKSLNGKAYDLRDWLTSYPFLLVAIDPYTIESSWILETSQRIFDHFSPADVRVGWICTADEQGCSDFLGPLSENYLTFPDPNREIVKSLSIENLPALVHIRSDGFMQISNGWNPSEWKSISHWLSNILAWSKTTIPTLDDPSPFSGTPADG